MPARRLSVALAALAALAICTLGAAPAGAAAPVAIVQEIDAPDSSFQFMDYVSAGDRIDLGRDGRLVLGYFADCTEETVTGGTVTVGTDRSSVDGGTVERHKVNCDGGGLALTEQQSARSGVIVFRKSAAPSATPKPSIRLHGASPVIRADDPGTLTLTRLDAPAKPIVLEAPTGVVDLAAHDIVLAPGGIYRAEMTQGDTVRTRVFEVDAFAPPGPDVPLVARLLRM